MVARATDYSRHEIQLKSMRCLHHSKFYFFSKAQFIFADDPQYKQVNSILELRMYLQINKHSESKAKGKSAEHED